MRISIDGCKMILLKTFRFFVYSCFILFIIFLGGNIYWLVVSDGYGFGLIAVYSLLLLSPCLIFLIPIPILYLVILFKIKNQNSDNNITLDSVSITSEVRSIFKPAVSAMYSISTFEHIASIVCFGFLIAIISILSELNW